MFTQVDVELLLVGSALCAAVGGAASRVLSGVQARRSGTLTQADLHLLEHAAEERAERELWSREAA